MKTVFLTGAELASPHPLVDREWVAIVAIPFIDGDLARRAAELMAKRAEVEDALLLAVHDQARAGFVNLVNEAFARTRSEFFGYAAQDAFPGRRWLARGLHALQTGDKHLLAFNDGKWMGALAAFGLARREWVLAQYGGAFFYPGYFSNYADAELSLLALNDQAYCYDPNSVLIEVDWEKDNAAVNAEDRQCFHERLLQKFDGKVVNPALLKMYA